MKKWTVRIVLALVILLVICVVALGLFLDTAIERGVETFGPRIAKVKVELAGVNLSLLKGSGSINGLVIGNPDGYQSPHAISVASSSMAINTGSLLSDKVVIKSIRVESPEVSLELGPGGSNLQKILSNLKAGSKPSTPDKGQESDAASGRKLQVDEVVVTGGKIMLSAAALGGKLSEAPLPEIRLTGLGAGPEGITASDLGTRILSAVMDGAIQISGDALTQAGKDTLDNALKGATNALNKSAGEAVGKAAKGLGELLKPKPQ